MVGPCFLYFLWPSSIPLDHWTFLLGSRTSRSTYPDPSSWKMLVLLAALLDRRPRHPFTQHLPAWFFLVRKGWERFKVIRRHYWGFLLKHHMWGFVWYLLWYLILEFQQNWGKESPFLISHDSSHCGKNGLHWSKRGRDENGWSAVAGRVRHNGCLEERYWWAEGFRMFWRWSCKNLWLVWLLGVVRN